MLSVYHTLYTIQVSINHRTKEGNITWDVPSDGWLAAAASRVQTCMSTSGLLSNILPVGKIETINT
jgi:hypothetical protein